MFPYKEPLWKGCVFENPEKRLFEKGEKRCPFERDSDTTVPKNFSKRESPYIPSPKSCV